MEIKKLDKRNVGYGNFKYYVKFSILLNAKSNLNFHEVRAWCWDTWGASKELSEWLEDNYQRKSNPIKPQICQNDHWAWQNDNYYCRIYLRTDQEMVFFRLRWE